MAKRYTETQLQPNTTGVFDNDEGETQRKVVFALFERGVSEDRIVKATGVPVARVRKLYDEWRKVRR